MNQPLPLARVQEAALEFLRHRDDAAVFGAQAVNAYVDEPRMTQDVDILSTGAADLAAELRAHLARTFTIAVRVRVVADGNGYRVFQLRQPKNRHPADVRQIAALPPNQVVADVRVPIPEELIAQKVMAYTRRRDKPKGGTGLRDVMVLLLAFPQFQRDARPVTERLHAAGADAEMLREWQTLAVREIDAGEEE